MRTVMCWAISGVMMWQATLKAEGVVIHVSDPDGAAARVGAPVSVEIDVERDFDGKGRPPSWYLEEVPPDGRASEGRPAVPVQFQSDTPDTRRGRLWWILPSGPSGKRRFRFAQVPVKEARVFQTAYDPQRQRVDLLEGRQPVLHYHHGPVPVPEGTPAHFVAGQTYQRGDYISPLFGPHGEELTEDYPRDHPHHRGVWWSWPVTRWKDQIADIWAVVGVWSRPEATPRMDSGRVFAVIEAENVWKFGAELTPIVREEVLIRAFRHTDRCRYVDVEIRLGALVDDVAIGGRPERGYGGFSLRAAPCQDRQITLHTDGDTATPGRSWLDYSGVFAGGSGLAGVTIFEHVSNPDYPNPLHEYPQCNCVMPAYPDKRQVTLSKTKPLVLRHRLWIHTGGPDQNKLADAWSAYARPPQVTLDWQ